MHVYIYITFIKYNLNIFIRGFVHPVVPVKGYNCMFDATTNAQTHRADRPPCVARGQNHEEVRVHGLYSI